MAKKRQKTQQNSGPTSKSNMPSFLKRQNDEEAPTKKQDNSSSDDFDSDDEKDNKQQVVKNQTKREIKQEGKERKKKSRQQGLPTGITHDDIEKFNEVIKKHGDGVGYALPAAQAVEEAPDLTINKKVWKIPDLINLPDFETKDKANQPHITILSPADATSKCYVAKDNTLTKKVNFNSQEDFSPDTDVRSVATNYLNWLFYPLSLKQFQTEMQHQQTYLLIQGRPVDWLNQKDPLDDLISIDMIKDSVKDQDGSNSNIQVDKVIGSNYFSIDMSKVDHKMFETLLQTCDIRIEIKQIQTFSASLRKMMSLFDESMQNDCSAKALIFTKSSLKEEEDLDDMYFNFENFDKYLMVISGQAKIILIVNEKAKEITLSQGDLLYIPKRQKYQIMQETDEKCLILEIDNNQSNNSQGNLLENMIEMAKKDASISTLMDKTLLTKNVWNHEEKNKDGLEQLFRQIVQKTFKNALSQNKEDFIRNRMSITEVMFPNEEVVGEENTDQIDDNEQEQEQDGDGDAVFDDDEESDDHKEEIDQITHIKIASPDSITISTKNDQKHIIISTQNTSIKKEINAQVQEFEIENGNNNLEQAIEIIKSAYPEYVSVKDGSLATLLKNNQKTIKQLYKLAELQAFVIL